MISLLSNIIKKIIMDPDVKALPSVCIQEFNITYEGTALDNNEIEARVLANSLLGLSEVIEEANTLINGKESKVFTKIRANPQPGSFIESIITLMSSDGPIAICNIIVLLGFSKGLIIEGSVDILAIGSLIGIYQKLQNNKIISREPAGSDYPDCTKITYGDDFSVNIKGNNNTVIVKNEPLKLFENAKIRKQMAEVMSPLDEDGVDSIHFGTDEKNSETITKVEKAYFKPPEKEPIDININILILTVISPDLDGHMKGWKFTYNTIEDKIIPITADIEDEEFLEEVAEGRVSFQNGTEIKAKLRIVQSKKIIRTTSHTILKVLEVIQPRSEETESEK